MPLYEYQCESCGQLLEVIQKFSDDPLTECSQCQGKLERLLSAPAIQFKGSGWYVTDYANKGSANASKESSSTDSGNTDKSESKDKTEAPAKTKSKPDDS